MVDDLYREICRCPGDDTLRLAYADWLGENGDPDRAEFVRVQFGLHPLNELAEVIHPAALLGSSGMQRESLLASNHRLHAAHPEWSRLPCETCEGKGYVMVDTGIDMPALGSRKGGRLHRAERCPTCSGTGDLFRAPGVSGASPTPPSRPRVVTFARGFPDAVSCTLAEAFAPDGVPTPWACEVVRRTPVTRFVLTDADPPGRDSGDKNYPFCWRDTMFTHGSGYVIADQCDKNYRTLERALDVFALAAGRLVRRHVYGDVKA